MGFKFRRQHQFGDYVADFYCHEAQLVVECDGAVHEENERWQHDQARDAYLTGHGLRVLRFTNEQVLEDIEITLKEISSYLQVPMDRRSRGRRYVIRFSPSPFGRGRERVCQASPCQLANSFFTKQKEETLQMSPPSALRENENFEFSDKPFPSVPFPKGRGRIEGLKL
jgi:NADH:ubiquinone oxidoreductase subunit E